MSLVEIGYALLAACGLGVLVAVVLWGATAAQARRWERMRQEVRDALSYEPVKVVAVPEDFEHDAILTGIVICEKHGTVSPDYCAHCRMEEYVALTRPGHVVHSD